MKTALAIVPPASSGRLQIHIGFADFTDALWQQVPATGLEPLSHGMVWVLLDCCLSKDPIPSGSQLLSALFRFFAFSSNRRLVPSGGMC